MPDLPMGERVTDRHDCCIGFLRRTARELSSQCLTDVGSLDDWRRKRPELLQELLYTLGLDPAPKRTSLRAATTGVLERRGYSIEKLVFQSMPGLYVTGNLYLPHERSAPVPAILYPCGHSPHPLGAKYDYQDRALWFAQHGYVCLVLDTLEFGEVAGLHHGVHDLNMWHWLSLGYTPIGVEVWNAIRALDYLSTRPEVDAKRIGMTGISGGGATTWFAAAVDERVAVAAPICSTYTFGSQADHWTASGQCDCIYVHNTFLRDFPVAGALIAPRPLLICSGRRDGDFPADGYHQVFGRVKRVYELSARASGPDRVREVDEDVGHVDSPLFRQETRAWMDRWLKNETGPAAAMQREEQKPETPGDLACLRDLPADAVNYHIHDRFIGAHRPRPPASLPHWEERRKTILGELTSKVFRWFPGQEIPFETRVTGDDGGWAAEYGDYKEVIFASEPGLPVRARLITPRPASKETPLLVYVKRRGDSIYAYDYDELLPLLGRFTVLILNPRLTESPVSEAEYAEIERTASWVGRTVAGMHVWDILRALAWASQEQLPSADSVTVYAKGDMAVVALYAALFDERVQRLVVSDPPGSHWQRPALLNVLRVTDTPEAAGAFAPRDLVFLGKIPRAFDLTRRIYRLCGRPDLPRCAASLPEALEAWRYPLGAE